MYIDYSLDYAIKLNQNNYCAWNNKGNALTQLGRDQEALNAYLSFIKYLLCIIEYFSYDYAI